MAGFWAGFAQGYADEKDRIEVRKQYQDALDMKKKEMLLQMAQRKSELGMTSGSDGSANTSGNAYAKSLIDAGATAEQVAELARAGGAKGLKGAWESFKANVDPKNPDSYSAVALRSHIDHTYLDVKGGGTPNIDELAQSLDVTLDPFEKDFMTTMSTLSPDVTVVAPLPTPAKPSIEQINTATNMMRDSVGDALLLRSEENTQALAIPDLTDQQRSDLVDEKTRIETAKTALSNKVIGPALSLVGGDIAKQFKTQNPQFNEVFFPGFDTPLQQDQPTQDTPQQSAQTTDSQWDGKYTESGLVFATEEEALAARDAGQIPMYTSFKIGNKTKFYPAG